MGISDYFGQDFASARAKFRSAAADSGAELFSYENPQAKGPNAESLFVDGAVLGSEEAKAALLTISGVHGVATFCG